MQTCTKLLLFLTRGSIALKCLVFFFCTFFAGLDNRLLVPKKKSHPYPQRPWLHRPTLRWVWKSHFSQWAIWTLWVIRGMWRSLWKQWVLLSDPPHCSLGHCAGLDCWPSLMQVGYFELSEQNNMENIHTSFFPSVPFTYFFVLSWRHFH